MIMGTGTHRPLKIRFWQPLRFPCTARHSLAATSTIPKAGNKQLKNIKGGLTKVVKSSELDNVK
jgi:hypothetical protein